MIYHVHGDSDNYFFSSFVTREFGENIHFILKDGSSIFSVVFPLNTYSQQLPIVGSISKDSL